MRLTLAHARAATLELARHPSYSVPTLLFPSMFFLFFVVPRHGGADAAPLLALYAGFAVLGVAFFQFGVGIAADRTLPWDQYLRTLPLGPAARFSARVISAAVFATLAVGALVATALPTTHVSLTPTRWVVLLASLLAGTVPFGLLGIALGYWAPPRGALPLANVLYLGLSFVGGLWTGPGALPHVVERVSPFLPTRQLADVLSAAVTGDVPLRHWAALAAYAGVFAVVAGLGYRRDEGTRYR